MVNKAHKEYQDMLHTLHFSEEQKTRMVERLMRTQEAGQTTPPRTRQVRRVALAAAAAAAVLAAGAGAAYVGLASDAFASVFGTTHTEIIDKIGYPVGVSASDAGVTITADAIVADRSNLSVIFTLTRADGQPWEPASYHFAEDDLSRAMAWKAGSGNHGASWFVDDNPQDAEMQYIQQMTVSDGVPRGKITATFRDLQIWDEAYRKSTTVVQGTWKLTFDLRCADSSVELLERSVTVQTDGGTARIQKVTISPLGFQVAGVYEQLNAQTQAALQQMQDAPGGKMPGRNGYDQLTSLPIVLHLKDGSTIDLRKATGYSLQDTASDHPAFQIGDSFADGIIPLEDMDYLTVCGMQLQIQTE